MEQKKYWQSFGEKNQSAAYNQDVKDEFKEELPFVADESKGFLETAAPRRDFLKYVGFSTAAAAVVSKTLFTSKKVSRDIRLNAPPERTLPAREAKSIRELPTTTAKNRT